MKKTHEQFIIDAKAVHGDRYDYSMSAYETAIKKIYIRCLDHGGFWQSPNKHLSGRGCKKCGQHRSNISKIVSFDDFFERAYANHGTKYEYDKSSYLSIDRQVRIKCKYHGWFEQLATDHCKSMVGCPLCAHRHAANSRAGNTEGFIVKAISIHGKRYSYEKTKYHRSGVPVIITCNDHGDFKQQPNNHLHGSGCPSCAKNGFSPNMPSFLYVLRSSCGSMIKIGITRNMTQRMSQLRKSTPFDFEIICKSNGDGKEIAALEKYYHSRLMSCGFSGFHGCKEWFRIDNDIIEEIKKGPCGP